MKRALHRAAAALGSSAALRLEFSVFLSFAAIFAFEFLSARAAQRELSREVIRLHVVADSDEDGAQRVKLCVRDRILEEFSGEIAAAGNPEEAGERILSLLPEIEAAAEDELLKNGFGLSVSASLSVESFPEKRYGDVTLPAGEYTALRVVIGSGNGKNWWCVMFPPLCSFAREDADEAVTGGDFGDEWEIATQETPEIRFRLRILEIFAGISEKIREKTW
ncbi:MAG: stage II sporulation protein R [Clostridiales bacterium]|nr:stage II sporulation protein R [Clostridiales bacterium]